MNGIHSFDESLRYERASSARADRFYREQLGADEVERYNRDTPEDMEMQHRDIDVRIRVHGVDMYVSEKFRKSAWDDLLIELYSKYPAVRGWMETGSPDLLAYFLPDKVLIFREADLKAFYDRLVAAIPQPDLDKFCAHAAESRSKQLKISLARPCSVRLLAALNVGYMTLSVAVPFDVLRENGVKWGEYPERM